MPKPKYQLSKEDKDLIANMVYAENASEDDATTKMTIQTAYNRLRSGRKKEFGKNAAEVLKKGYYSVSKNSPLYQEATSKKFKDVTSKARHASIRKQIDAIEGDQDFGKAMFFFKPGEAQSLRKKLKSTGKVGKYDTYSY